MFVFPPASQWMLACLGAFISMNVHFSAILWVVKQEGEPDHVPWWRALTMCILLPEICLTGAVGRVGRTCSASSPDALFCYEKDEMLQYLYNGLMVPAGLSVIWTTTKHGPCADFQMKILLFFSGHLFKQALIFLCKAMKQTEVLIKQRLALTKTMCG